MSQSNIPPIPISVTRRKQILYFALSCLLANLDDCKEFSQEGTTASGLDVDSISEEELFGLMLDFEEFFKPLL